MQEELEDAKTQIEDDPEFLEKSLDMMQNIRLDITAILTKLPTEVKYKVITFHRKLNFFI